MKLKILFCFLFFSTSLSAQITRFEKSNGTESASYFEGSSWWGGFGMAHYGAETAALGETDAGYNLQIVTLSDKPFTLYDIKKSKKTVILINNAIHPGEPDGVDASMMLFRDFTEKEKYKKLLKNCILVCIPYYNIGGAINRGKSSRANQEGPMEYGFRGNAQNLDLNRDFIKCDSKNAMSFSKLLQLIDPDIYIETHVSNGADYQYTMTYLATQPDKLGFGMGNYLQNKMIPSLEKRMANKKETMIPYVNHHSGALKDKMFTFYDSPRYSSGLTTLHQSFGFITETHMLKNFRDRTWATYKFLVSTIEFCSENAETIQAKRKAAKAAVTNAKTFHIDWRVDTATHKTFKFNGYKASYKESKVTGAQRLFYDRSKPKVWDMKYYHKMKPTKTVTKPKFYILKKGYWRVVDRLKANGVKLIPLENDSILSVNSFHIKDYQSDKRPYEKHYHHSNVQYDLEKINYQFREGDYLIPMNTGKNRFIVEVLEPAAPDSYFNWNFFDAVLQQKEWYSSYVFEDKASQLLINNEKLKIKFEAKKNTDKKFRDSPREQLYWIYKHSSHYEKEHMRLPVFRIE
jgi:hypothetical protein